MATVMWSPSLMALIILIGMVVVLFLLVIIRWLLRELWKARHPGQQMDPEDPSRRNSREPIVAAEEVPEAPPVEDKPPSYDEAVRLQRDQPACYVNVQFISDSLPPA